MARWIGERRVIRRACAPVPADAGREEHRCGERSKRCNPASRRASRRRYSGHFALRDACPQAFELGALMLRLEKRCNLAPFATDMRAYASRKLQLCAAVGTRVDVRDEPRGIATVERTVEMSRQRVEATRVHVHTG